MGLLLIAAYLIAGICFTAHMVGKHAIDDDFGNEFGGFLFLCALMTVFWPLVGVGCWLAYPVYKRAKSKRP